MDMSNIFPDYIKPEKYKIPISTYTESLLVACSVTANASATVTVTCWHRPLTNDDDNDDDDDTPTFLVTIIPPYPCDVSLHLNMLCNILLPHNIWLPCLKECVRREWRNHNLVLFRTLVHPSINDWGLCQHLIASRNRVTTYSNASNKDA